MKYRPICVAVLLAAGCSACGYQFIAGGPGPVIGGAEDPARLRALRASAPRLMVATVENRSFEPDLDARFTEFVRREFAIGSGAKVVSDPASAQFRLNTTIESVTLPSLSFTQTGTFESRAIVTVSAEVKDLQTGNVVWRQQTIGSSEFFITDDLQFNRVLQTRAIEQAGEQLAADLAASFSVHLETTLEERADGSPPTAGASPTGGAPPAIPPAQAPPREAAHAPGTR